MTANQRSAVPGDAEEVDFRVHEHSRKPARTSCRVLGLTLLLALASSLPAGDPPEKARTLCDFKDPWSGCPGPRCTCVAGTLKVTFDGDTDSVLQYETFQEGLLIEATVVTEVLSGGIHGWGFGVAHDPEFLDLLEVEESPFCALSYFDVCTSRAEESWGSGDECRAQDPGPGSGWISSVLLRPGKLEELPLGRIALSRAVYKLRKDPGEEGTLLSVSSCLSSTDSLPVEIFVDAEGDGRIWDTVVDGWVKRAGTSTSFLRGDLDGNGKINILDGLLHVQTRAAGLPPAHDCADVMDANDDGKVDSSDAVTILRHVFGRGSLPEPFPDCEPDPTPDGIKCVESNCAAP